MQSIAHSQLLAERLQEKNIKLEKQERQKK